MYYYYLVFCRCGNRYGEATLLAEVTQLIKAKCDSLSQPHPEQVHLENRRGSVSFASDRPGAKLQLSKLLALSVDKFFCACFFICKMGKQHPSGGVILKLTSVEEPSVVPG